MADLSLLAPLNYMITETFFLKNRGRGSHNLPSFSSCSSSSGVNLRGFPGEEIRSRNHSFSSRISFITFANCSTVIFALAAAFSILRESSWTNLRNQAGILGHSMTERKAPPVRNTDYAIFVYTAQLLQCVIIFICEIGTSL